MYPVFKTMPEIFLLENQPPQPMWCHADGVTYAHFWFRFTGLSTNDVLGKIRSSSYCCITDANRSVAHSLRYRSNYNFCNLNLLSSASTHVKKVSGTSKCD